MLHVPSLTQPKSKPAILTPANLVFPEPAEPPELGVGLPLEAVLVSEGLAVVGLQLEAVLVSEGWAVVGLPPAFARLAYMEQKSEVPHSQHLEGIVSSTG